MGIIVEGRSCGLVSPVFGEALETASSRLGGRGGE